MIVYIVIIFGESITARTVEAEKRYWLVSDD